LKTNASEEKNYEQQKTQEGQRPAKPKGFCSFLYFLPFLQLKALVFECIDFEKVPRPKAARHEFHRTIR
jgi:hypothetical protein